MTQVIGAKLAEPSSLFVPMMKDGCTHMEYTGSTDRLFVFFIPVSFLQTDLSLMHLYQLPAEQSGFFGGDAHKMAFD